jgi:hypothetical protein
MKEEKKQGRNEGSNKEMMIPFFPSWGFPSFLRRFPFRNVQKEPPAKLQRSLCDLNCFAGPWPLVT